MSHNPTDRNLLFGILALQMNFVSRDALVLGMNAWILDKNKPLGRVLCEQGTFPEDAHDLLEALVAKHLELHKNDARQSLQALSSAASFRDELESVKDADVQATLSIVGTNVRSDQEATVALPSGTTEAGMRYRILRPHAKGGLGHVYIAEDLELHRQVAFKEIQLEHAFDKFNRERFVMEAEITGGLEHPGIVPVYGLGTYADGRPFYAMRFIKGDNLREAIERFHSAKWNSPAEENLAFRQLLRRFIDVCNAIAYAHSRGILHRDIKPGNVMLGQYGETLVVDWGLAKAVGRREKDLASASTEATLVPKSASGSQGTQDGSVLGTPAYMSPEQAAGKLDELGPASDVYSLGAMLYSLLVGQPPFQGETCDVLKRVKEGNCQSPRKMKPTLPAALEAICEKAMALKAENRYPDAHVLACEIERWLADEPVSAHRETVLQQTRRWARRHRTWVQAAAALLVVATAFALAALLRESQLRQKVRDSLQESLYQQAHSLWSAKTPGWRAKSLAAIREAAIIHREPRLRHAAAQSLVDWAYEDQGVLQFEDAVNAWALLTNPEELVVAVGSGIEFRSQTSHVLRGVWRPSQAPIVCIKVAPEDKLVVAADRDGFVHVGRRNNLASMRSWRAHDGAVTDMSFGPGAGRFSTTDGEHLRVWELETGTLIAEDRCVRSDAEHSLPPPAAVESLESEDSLDSLASSTLGSESFRKRNAVIATGIGSHEIFVCVEKQAPIHWRYTDGKLEPKATLSQLPAGTNIRLALTPNGRYLILACNEPRYSLGASPPNPPPPPPAPATPPPAGGTTKKSTSDSSPRLAKASIESICLVGFQPNQPWRFPDGLFVSVLSSRQPEQPIDLHELPTLISGPLRKVHCYVLDLERNEVSRSREEEGVFILHQQGVVIRLGEMIELSVSSKGNLVQIVGSRGAVAVFRLANAELELLNTWATGGHRLMGAAWSSDGTRITVQETASSLRFGELSGQSHSTFLRAKSKERPYSHDSEWSKLVASPGAPLAALVQWARPIEILDADSGTKLGMLDESYVRECLWTRDGRRLFVVTPPDQFDKVLGNFTHVRVGAMENMREGVLKADAEKSVDVGFSIVCARLSPNDRWVAFSGHKSGIAIYKTTPTGLALDRTLSPQKETVVNLAFNSSGTVLAAADLRGAIRLWNTSDWSVRRELPIPKKTSSLLSFGSEGRYFAAALDSGKIMLWNTHDWSILHELETGAGLLTMAFSQDGRYLVTGDREGKISIWEVETAQLCLQWKGHSTGVSGLQIASDFGRIVSSGMNGEVRAWHVDPIRESLRVLGLDW